MSGETDVDLWSEDLVELYQEQNKMMKLLLEAGKSNEWQPIETAPKDGTPVLVYAPDSFGEDVSVCRFFDSYEDFRCEMCDGEYCPYGEPTHWMPLPDPPNKQENGS